MKRNDTYPPLEVTCSLDGSAFDLTGYTCTLTMTLVGSGTPKINKAAVTLTDAPNGVVSYEWAAGDTDTEGDYEIEIEAVNGSDVITFPGSGAITLTIEADLA